MSRLLAALRRVSTRLREAEATFALVGGLATSARTEPRFTRDVDICVAVADDAEAESLVRSLGLAIATQVEQDATGRLATVRLVDEAGQDGPVIDLLFASSGIEAEIVARADELQLARGLRVPVASTAHLIALKVLARDDVTRPQDRVDLVRLIAVASDEDLADARSALQLIDARGFSRSRDLRGGLQALLDEVRPG